MSDWTTGYVAEVNYTHGFYRELTPAVLAFAALVKGQDAPDLSKPLTYCELGCGQGFSANALAAANAASEFYANDFNPSQIAGANRLAVDAGVPNVHFSDASFQDYIDDPVLPAFDIIVLHGIYSWVSAENRTAIVDFIARKLKVGGLVYISYNTLPGWAPAMPLRRLFIEHAASSGGPLLARIEKSLVFTEQLKAANAAYFRDLPAMGGRFDAIKGQNRSYLAHEYFNRDWSPLYFADVAAELGEAKLSFMGSGNVLDHIPGINLTPDQRALLAQVADPIQQETVRDYLTMQQFRRDLFVRGGRTLGPDEVTARWRGLRLCLSVPRDEVSLKVAGLVGQVTMQEESYAPLLDGLADGPRTVGQLAADRPAIAALGDVRLKEVITVLVGGGSVHPCLDAAGDARRAKQTRAFNAAVLSRAVWSQDLAHLASPVTGGGVTVDRIQQLFLLALQEKHGDPTAFVWGHLKAQNQKLLKDGKALEGDEENLAELALRYEAFNKRLPVLRRLGIA